MHASNAYSITCLKRPLSKRPKIGFQDLLTLNAGQKFCRMLQGEHSAILLTFIKLPFVIKIFVFSIFEWPLKTGFTVFLYGQSVRGQKTLLQTTNSIWSYIEHNNKVASKEYRYVHRTCK